MTDRQRLREPFPAIVTDPRDDHGHSLDEIRLTSPSDSLQVGRLIVGVQSRAELTPGLLEFIGGDLFEDASQLDQSFGTSGGALSLVLLELAAGGLAAWPTVEIELLRLATGSVITHQSPVHRWRVEADANDRLNVDEYGVGVNMVDVDIVAGEIDAVGSFLRVDTESDAASDDLDTINGGTNGGLMILKAFDSARTVVVKDGTGNLRLNGDFSLDSNVDTIMLVHVNTLWLELSRSDNAA